MNVTMEFPATFDEFAEQYKLVDEQKIYTNGTELIPIYRAKQWIENANAASKSDWISVEERLPEDGMKRVAVFLQDTQLTANIGSNRIDTDRYLNGKWVRWGMYVTHWMPLPAPPEE